jgi:hypothetical protein
MMPDRPDTIDHGHNARCAQVEEWLFGLDPVTPELRARVVTARVSTRASSRYADLSAMPMRRPPRIAGWSGTSTT